MNAIRSESERDLEFAAWVKSLRGGENIQQCIHCGVCSGSCPPRLSHGSEPATTDAPRP